MFVTDPITGEMTWMPRSMCFADAEGDDDAGSADASDGSADASASADADNSGDAASDGDASASADAAAKSEDHWASEIKDQVTRTFAERYGSQEEAVRAGLTFRQQVSERVQVLGDKSTPDEVAAFRVAVGAPAESSGYEIPLPEGMTPENIPDNLKGFHSAMQTAAFDTALSPAQFQKLAAAYTAAVSADYEHSLKNMDATVEQKMNDLRTLWPGPLYDQNHKFSQAAALKFGDAAFFDWIGTAEVEGVKIGDHPNFIKAFAAIGAGMDEDYVAAFPSTPANAASLQEQLKVKVSAQMDLMDTGENAKARAMQSEIDAITAKMSGGGQPVVGAAGRTV